ncbi:hypothetical protein P6709_06670 [Jeotgalibacillus sp. ET6]|uniref:hypothetical protein n=1 Tax=Jeotgalibacillus sp. ET6 TaxID=3037260 RepID=UPI0024186DFD|nr:hypothetical protein [Jeotgalibacillus sp. ET6]MDG5471424.1 hypothetical protein [Jeotgalibacillus sp. ET6]
MGIFDYFKKSSQQEKPAKEEYWSLSTNEEKIVNPTWEQVKQAVGEAVPEKALFASLGYYHSDSEIEVIQAIQLTQGINEFRLEALPPNVGKIFINNGLSLDETVKFFEEFYKYKRVVGYENWPTEKV